MKNARHSQQRVLKLSQGKPNCLSDDTAEEDLSVTMQKI
jgi:hypothetical protein